MAEPKQFCIMVKDKKTGKSKKICRKIGKGFKAKKQPRIPRGGPPVPGRKKEKKKAFAPRF